MKTKGVKNINKGKVEYHHGARTYLICQRSGGIHIHERYSRDPEVIIPFSKLLEKPAEDEHEHVTLQGRVATWDLSRPENEQLLALECNMAALDLDAIVAAANEMKFGLKRGPSQLDAGHIKDCCDQIRKVYRMLKGIKVPPAATSKELSARYGALGITEVYAPQPIR